MKCKECKAYGVDDLGFRGCLVRHTMEDLPNGSVGCRRHKNTIIKEISAVKKDRPSARYYRWINDKE